TTDPSTTDETTDSTTTDTDSESDSDPTTTTTTGGVDESTCELAAQSLTSAGCLFAPLVLQVYANLPWAVIAGNTNEEVATATLYGADGQMIESAQIMPGDAHTFMLSGDSPVLQNHLIDSVTGVFPRALKLESDIPVVAFQFAPFSSSQQATSDAAILLPYHAWGDNYLAAAYHNSDNSDSWLSIVSFDDGNEVTVLAPTYMTGQTSAGGGFPALAAGESGTIIVNDGEVLRVLSPGSGPADLTGVKITSTAPVALFAGAPTMSIPGPGFVPYKDHLEEQLPPRTAWGTEYAVIHFRPRGGEEDLYRFVADKDGTTITLSGDYNDVLNLNEGEFAEVRTTESFHAAGSESFMVAHYMYSQGMTMGPKDDALYPGSFLSPNCGPQNQQTTELGDPALSFFPPIDQYRYNYTFLTPTTYAWDMMTIIAPMAGWDSILLDGGALPESPTDLGVAGLGYARFLLNDGPHEIHSDAVKFGMEIYGYDCRVSYAFPGGLSLAEINEPPQ
ncbi:MAG: IgGFc-binding protein, partial [Myxococcales bacterium]|nr:IgGFc-binding protein [Myxococcales bacterium]